MFIPGHTFKLMSRFYVSIFQTWNELLHRVQKLENCDASKKYKTTKPREVKGQASLSQATKQPVDQPCSAPRLSSWRLLCFLQHFYTNISSTSIPKSDGCLSKAVNTALAIVADISAFMLENFP